MRCPLHRILFVPAALVSLLVFGPTTVLFGQQTAPPEQAFQQGDSVEQQGVETLTRGPIHEAFAEVVSYDPQPGITVPNQPPEPINELPPEQRPDDETVIWIPGYWSWSEDQNDFIWISGVWRVPPPGSQWVPGYWNQVQNGYQWISGYWWVGDEQGQDQDEQLTYLPAPPDSLEQGPNSPQPADDQFWVPGVWVWQDTQYVWRAGYWAQIRPDWVWIPDHYIWTPSGCVFIAGHWDYTMPRRGLCFSPVRLQPAVYTRPNFRYVPAVLIDVPVVFYHLFCRPAHNHYYFGDYYDPRYRKVGIQPWFDLYQSRVAYEPFYVYNRWYFRHHEPQRDWSQRIRRWYDYRVRHPDARPPHTYREMRDLLRRDGARQPGLLEVAVSFDRAQKRKEFPVKLVPVDQQYRDRMIDVRGQVRDFSRERVEREKELKQRFAEGKPDKPQRIKFPTPPVRGERVGLGERAERPGQRDRQAGRLPEVPSKPGAKEKPDDRSFLGPELPEPPDTPDAGKPETPEKPDRRGKPDRPDRKEAPGRPEGPEKPQRRAPGKPEAPEMEWERGKTPPTERERPERRRPQERDFPRFGGDQPERQQPEKQQSERQQPERQQPERQQPERRQPERRQPEGRQPERQPEADARQRPERQPEAGDRQRQKPQRELDRRGPQDRSERSGDNSPQRPQRSQQPDRPQPRQPQDSRRDKAQPSDQRQGPDQPQGFQGSRDTGRGRQTPGVDGGRAGGGRDAQFRGPSDRGGRPEARSPDRNGDDDRNRRRGRDER